MSGKNPRSPFFARVKDLIRDSYIDRDYVLYSFDRHSRYYGKNAKKFWQTKFMQQLYIEKSRVVIDDKVWMITANDGVLAEMY